MKGITKFKIFYVAITVMILTAALAIPAAAQKQVPFKGSIQAQETDTIVPPAPALTPDLLRELNRHPDLADFSHDSRFKQIVSQKSKWR